MKNKFLPTPCLHFVLCGIVCSLMLATSFDVGAQEQRAAKGQMATCQILVSENISKAPSNLNAAAGLKGKTAQPRSKNHQPKLNQIGYFDRVVISHGQQNVAVNLTYPNVANGEKVVLAALDGGQFDNGKKIKVVQLNSQRKFSFDFQLTDQPGLFRVSVKKGNDIKVVQLWVDPSASLSSK